MPEPAYRYNAHTIRVIDGDTIVLNVDLGFHCSLQWSFRLYGLDAPSHTTLEGKAATAWLTTAAAGNVLVDSHGEDKYGRWLGTLYAAGNPVSINDQMVVAAHAVPWLGKGPHPVGGGA